MNWPELQSQLSHLHVRIGNVTMPIIPSSRYQGWHYSVAEAFMSPLRSQGAPYLSHQPLSIPQPFPSPSPTSPTSLAPSHARPRPPLPPRFPGPDVSEPVAKPRPFPPSPVCPEYSPQLSDSGCSPPGGRTAPNPLPPSRAPGRSSPASPGPIGPVPGSSGQSRAEPCRRGGGVPGGEARTQSKGGSGRQSIPEP